MKCPRHAPVAFQLPDVADVDEDHVVAPMQLHRFLGGHPLDLPLGGFDEGAVAKCDLLRHVRRNPLKWRVNDARLVASRNNLDAGLPYFRPRRSVQFLGG